jgi:hypothetical protein
VKATRGDTRTSGTAFNGCGPMSSNEMHRLRANSWQHLHLHLDMHKRTSMLLRRADMRRQLAVGVRPRPRLHPRPRRSAGIKSCWAGAKPTSSQTALNIKDDHAYNTLLQDSQYWTKPSTARMAIGRLPGGIPKSAQREEGKLARRATKGIPGTPGSVARANGSPPWPSNLFRQYRGWGPEWPRFQSGSVWLCLFSVAPCANEAGAEPEERPRPAAFLSQS